MCEKIKISKKQQNKEAEWFYLPRNSGMGHFATWEKTDEGLLLRPVKVSKK